MTVANQARISKRLLKDCGSARNEVIEYRTSSDDRPEFKRKFRATSALHISNNLSKRYKKRLSQFSATLWSVGLYQAFQYAEKSGVPQWAEGRRADKRSKGSIQIVSLARTIKWPANCTGLLNSPAHIKSQESKMSDKSGGSEGTTYSEKHDPYLALQGWISDVQLSRQIGTSMFAALGKILDTDEVVALLCPRCIKGHIVMHRVWAKCPHKELVRFAKTEIELVRIMGMVCDACRADSAENEGSLPLGPHLTKQQALDSSALLPLRSQGGEVMTIADNDESVGNIMYEFFVHLRTVLHVIPISDLIDQV